MLEFRKATEKDLSAIARIYDEIHTAEEKGLSVIGWIRNIYPTNTTAENALKRNDLFVAEYNGMIIGSAIIDQQQVDVYEHANWQYCASDDDVMVLHTLVVSPKHAGKGYGRKFVRFYEEYADINNCKYLRMDTNEKNTAARALYNKLEYKEIDILPCTFNGIKDVNMVLLEKKL